MTKKELGAVVETAKLATRDALQTLYDALNSGQRKKILKDDAVYGLLQQYEVVL